MSKIDTDDESADSEKLNARQKAFCAWYVVYLNATKAAKKAGYSQASAKVIGAQLMAHQKVRARIDKMLAARAKRIEITQDEVLRRIYDIAMANLNDVVEWDHLQDVDDGTDAGTTRAILRIHVKDSTTLSKRAHAGIAEISETIEMNGSRTHKVKMRDPSAMVRLLANHVGIGTKKIEVTGKDGKPIRTKVTAGKDLIDMIRHEVLGVPRGGPSKPNAKHRADPEATEDDAGDSE